MILTGDCLTQLRTMPDCSVHCCVTSPPYFGLRDYGHEGQIGLEETPDAYVARLVEVFREVRRVLRDDGTLWLNLGDSYAGSGPSGASYKSKTTLEREGKSSDGSFRISKTLSQRGLTYAEKKPVPPPGLKSKDLIGIPWRVAFALQADGWYLRQDIIWHKPNPMPESVRDRCTKSHEYIFMLSKSARYYYDADAVAEPVTDSTIARVSQPTLEQQAGSTRAVGKTNGNMKAVVKKQDGHGRRHAGFNDRYFGQDGAKPTRNKRSVWTVTTKPFKGAHFATFPPDLIEPCVLAGCPVGGVVLDPFGGAGTTAIVAMRNKRRSILIELNPDYVTIAQERVLKEALA
jgi:DNA modification methylase